jgi:thiamine kinase-like enzyme
MHSASIPMLKLGEIDLSIEELAQQHIVFCHGDLEPRNILVQPSTSPHSLGSYEVAAIIDWEMAGFYSLGYEYVTKNSLLGLSNQSFS